MQPMLRLATLTLVSTLLGTGALGQAPAPPRVPIQARTFLEKPVVRALRLSDAQVARLQEVAAEEDA